jgi:hypothetical protein
MTNLSDKYKDSLPFDSSNITTIISNYTASNNETVFVNSASSALTVTLPASPTQGSKIKVLDIAANSQNNNISVLGNGNNINGASAYIINTPDSSVEVMYINSTKGWNVLNEYISLTKPGSPTGVSAVDVGTGRAYNNGAATVSFTPSTSGDTAASYTVTSTPGSYSASGTSSPIVVTGLQSNTSYTFKVFASNAAGSSTESVASEAITATTVPQTPTITGVTAGFEKVDIAFSSGATGGKAISTYTVTKSDSGTTTGASSPISYTSLTGGTSYTFTITATNANGTSAASTASSSATPFTASGGTAVSTGGYRYHKFTSTANLTVSGTIPSTEYIVIAGGGGGGDDAGGGGGAGGLLYANNQSLSSGTYTATIGGGGGENASGSNSSFNSQTAIAGGRGGAYGPGLTGTSGGSGGGGGGNGGGGAGTAGQGNNGGSGANASGMGNGGGAGTAGGTRTGGLGTNSYSVWAIATSSGYNSGFFAGGGQGGIDGAGGTSGDGNSAGGNGGNASVNTGCGGGGGRYGVGPSVVGGSGGSGIVIVRYPI